VDQAIEHLRRLKASLWALGPRRLALLAATALIVAALVSGAAWWAGKPVWETLYVGLDRQDSARIGAALREAGMSFDASSDGQTIFVRAGEAPQARALLAERGLPQGSSGGYELFDKLGSLGLTTFMQEVTKVRAIEGELARSIQLLRGVRAARVHVVPADQGAFRREKRAATASVVIRGEGANEAATASAIRRLVAAAVPGMSVDGVTVLSADGAVLASGEDGADAGATRVRVLEREVAHEAETAIRRTLSPLLGPDNIQVSVAASLNLDKRRVEETIYNPDSKVERSIRVVRENQSAQNAGQGQATTVERNLPTSGPRAGEDSKGNSEEQSKREETTNFELSSKRVQTQSDGYAIERLTAAVVVNRASLAAAKADGEKPDPQKIAAEMKEIEGLVAQAMGLRSERGDQVKISAIDFLAPEAAPEAASSGFLTLLARNLGVILSSLAALAVAALALVFGVRPLTRALAALPAPEPALPPLDDALPELGGMPHMAIGAMDEPPPHLDPPRRVAQRKLEAIVDLDEHLAADILKQMVRGDAPPGGLGSPVAAGGMA
jgi:flagellar M-ring protein FliF